MSKTATAKPLTESPTNADLFAFGLTNAHDALASMLALVRASVPGIGQVSHTSLALQRQLDCVAFAAAAFRLRLDVRAELEQAATTWGTRGKRPDFS